MWNSQTNISKSAIPGTQPCALVYIAYGCFCSIMDEFSRFDRGHMVYKTENITDTWLQKKCSRESLMPLCQEDVQGSPHQCYLY